VVEDLVNEGFDRSTISLVASDTVTRYGETYGGSYRDPNQIGGMDADVEAGEGAGFGAVVGTLVGLGFALVPGVGPILAGGTLAATALSAAIGAVTGAATGGIAASLINLGIPEEEAHAYSEAIRRGSAFVSITVEDSWANQVRNIMNRHDPIDLDEQVSSYRETGWTGYSPDIPPYTADEIYRERETAKNRKVSMGRTATAERLGVRNYDTNPRSFEAYNPGFRNHYGTTYSGSGYSYDYYLPAYRFGYDLRTGGQYLNHRWEDVEPDARRRWEQSRPNTWEQFKAAVRNAWDEVTD